MQHIHSILTRYFMGEASPEEAETVQAWIAASPENKAGFEEQWKLMELTTETPFVPVANLPAEWSAVTKSLPAGKMLAGSKTGLSWGLKLGLSVVAVTTLVVISVNLFNGKKKEPVVNLHSGSQTLTDTLNSGTILFLDTNTTVSYPETGKTENKIRLTGTVFVRKTEEDTLAVEAGAVEILVGKGDVFIQYDSARNLVLMQVRKGIAFVRDPSGTHTLAAGEAMQIEGKGFVFSKVQKISVNRFGYATRIFEFDDTPLKEVVAQLEKAYQVRISFAENELGNYRISTLLENVPLEDALKIITYTLELTYHYNGDKQVILSRKDREEK